MLRSGPALAVLACLSPGALAQEIERAQTLNGKRPQAFAAFRAVLPEAYRPEPWAYDLDGTSEPIDLRTIGGRQYVLGFSCKPHDCSANSLAFLAATDGSRAVAMVQAPTYTGRVAEVYGPATPQERAVLKDVLSIPR